MSEYTQRNIISYIDKYFSIATKDNYSITVTVCHQYHGYVTVPAQYTDCAKNLIKELQFFFLISLYPIIFILKCLSADLKFLTL